MTVHQPLRMAKFKQTISVSKSGLITANPIFAVGIAPFTNNNWEAYRNSSPTQFPSLFALHPSNAAIVCFKQNVSNQCFRYLITNYTLTNYELQTLPVSVGPNVRALEFSPSGQTLTIFSDDTTGSGTNARIDVYQWNTNNHTLGNRLYAAYIKNIAPSNWAKPIVDIAFSPSGKSVVAVGAGTTVSPQSVYPFSFDDQVGITGTLTAPTTNFLRSSTIGGKQIMFCSKYNFLGICTRYDVGLFQLLRWSDSVGVVEEGFELPSQISNVRIVGFSFSPDGNYISFITALSTSNSIVYQYHLTNDGIGQLIDSISVGAFSNTEQGSLLYSVDGNCLFLTSISNTKPVAVPIFNETRKFGPIKIPSVISFASNKTRMI